jgi:hypothetical protein
MKFYVLWKLVWFLNRVLVERVLLYYVYLLYIFGCTLFVLG